MWTWKLRPFPTQDLEALHTEVGSRPWGFKDPRTTHTYHVWLTAFPSGPRLYSYRGHQEYLRRSLRTSGVIDFARARQRMRAWIAYNEAIVTHCSLDAAAGRPWALVRYDELMEAPALIETIQAATGVPLQDARRPELQRTKAVPARKPLSLRERLYVVSAEVGQKQRLHALYVALNALRLRA